MSEPIRLRYTEFISLSALIGQDFEAANVTQDQLALAGIFLSADDIKTDEFDERYVEKKVFEKHISDYFANPLPNPPVLTAASRVELRDGRYYLLGAAAADFTIAIDKAYDLTHEYIKLEATVTLPESKDENDKIIPKKTAKAVYLIKLNSASPYKLNLIGQKYEPFK